MRKTLLALLLMIASPAAAQQATGLTLDASEPIAIESDDLEVRDRENLAIFTGNVTVTQDDKTLKAGRMEVRYANDGNAEGGSTSAVPIGSGNIERINVAQTVLLSSGDQTATGDEGIFDVRNNSFVLTGDRVVLSEGDNVITGCKLSVDTSTGRAVVDPCGKERVRVLITPGSQGN